jgi:hypothetical protein
MKIRTQCRGCGFPFKVAISPVDATLECPNCNQTLELPSLEDWNDEPPRLLVSCPVCGCRHLYRERHFNRALGCFLVLVGAAFVPWTYGLSLVLLSGVDLIMYHRLKESVVCYRCDTVFIDAEPTERHGDFDLLKHDVLKYGKTWQDVEGAEETLE